MTSGGLIIRLMPAFYHQAIICVMDIMQTRKGIPIPAFQWKHCQNKSYKASGDFSWTRQA